MKVLFTSVHVQDLALSLEFYINILGFVETTRITPKPGTKLIFLKDENDGLLQLVDEHHNQERSDNQSESIVTIAISVTNLEECLNKMKMAGIVPFLGPFSGANREYIAFIKDPNGINIELIEG